MVSTKMVPDGNKCLHISQVTNANSSGHSRMGTNLEGRRIQVLSDNSASVVAINNHSSKVKEFSHLLHCLAFITAYHQYELVAKHISGKHNILVHAISCNNLSLFDSLHPQAQRQPTPLPAELLQLVILEWPDRTLHRWTELWTATLMQD